MKYTNCTPKNNVMVNINTMDSILFTLGLKLLVNTVSNRIIGIVNITKYNVPKLNNCLVITSLSSISKYIIITV